MSELNFKKISYDCSKYKSKKLIEALVHYDSNSSVKSLVRFETRNSKHFIIHDNEKRGKRNDFFNSLINSASNETLIGELKKILIICQTSEQLIDDVKTGLDSIDLMKLSVNQQCWAVISNALQEGYHLQELIENHILSYAQKNKSKIFSLSNKNIQDENDNSFSPDSSLDKIVQYLTLTLKMFSHKHNLLNINSGEIVVPAKIKVEDGNVEEARKVFYCALIWNELINCTKSCILFDNFIEFAGEEEIPHELKSDGLKNVIRFNRSTDPFERFDAISNERLSRRLSQNLWEGVSDYHLDKKVFKDITHWNGRNDGYSILIEEYPFLVSLMEAISSHDINQVVLGLSLKEWVRGYSVIAYMAQNAMKRVDYTNNELTCVLRLGGLSEERAALFLTLITFGSDSRDIYDSPLIKKEDSTFLLFTPAFSAPQISNIILSKFSSKQADLSNKGFGFEKDISSTLNKYGIINESFKFKRELDEFEYDSVFLLDKKAFVLECKNTNLSSNSVTRAYQKKEFLEETSIQVKRLVNGLKKYPEVFNEKFGENINDYEVIPVIMNNLPISIPGAFNGVYITDSSAFNRLIKSKYINAGVIGNENGFIRTRNLKPTISQWEGDKLSAVDILNHFNNPVQLQDFIKYSSLKEYPMRVSRESMFINALIETDYDAMSKEHAEIMESLQGL